MNVFECMKKPEGKKTHQDNIFILEKKDDFSIAFMIVFDVVSNDTAIHV